MEDSRGHTLFRRPLSALPDVLTLDDVIEATTLGGSTIRKLVAVGKFPAPMQNVPVNCSLWSKFDVQQEIERWRKC